MFYEEKYIDGVLMCRSTPDGEWRPVPDRLEKAIREFAVACVWGTAERRIKAAREIRAAAQATPA